MFRVILPCLLETFMSQGKLMKSQDVRRAVIRLLKGDSLRACAKEIKCSPSTIHRLKDKLEKSKLTLDEVNLLNDKDLMDKLYDVEVTIKNHKVSRVIVHRKFNSDPVKKAKQLRPNFKVIAQQVIDSKRNIQLFWRDYQDECILCGKEPVSRSYFYTRVREEKSLLQPPETKVKMYQYHPYGKEIMMDFAGNFWPVYDANGNVTAKLPILVLTWPASGYIKALILANATTGVVCAGIARLLTIVGVQADILTLDNFKSAVDKHMFGKEAIINKSFLFYMSTIGLDVQANNPASPREKGPVESGVGLVQRRCLPRLAGKHYDSLEQGNIALDMTVEKYINEEGYKENGTGTPRKELFLQYEVPACNPVKSPMPQYFKHLFFLKVDDFYLVEINKSKYSVPYKYAGKYVDAQINGREVVILYKSKVIAIHPININHTEPLIAEEHMPKHHQAVKDKQRKYEHPEELLRDAKICGSYVYKYCKGLLDHKGLEPTLSSKFFD